LAHGTKRARPGPGLAALGLAAALGLGGPAGAEEAVVDGIAAQVGSDIVLLSEVRNLVGPVEERMRAAGAPEAELAALRADGLERLIERAMIKQVVRRAELEATDVEIDQAIANIARENGLALEQLAATVEAQGLPYPVYRERIRGEIEQSKVLNGMVASKVRVEDAELRAAYHEEYEDQPAGGQEVRLRHLLIPYTSDAPEARKGACAAAERARVRIAGGESFDVVASQIPEKAPGSGDIGWVHEDRLAGWMTGPVRGAAAGSVTPVLETDFGCNLLEVVERRPYEPRAFEQVREQVYQRLFAEKMQREYLKFMDKLREQTYVERKGVFAQAQQGGLFGGSAPGEDPSGF
jgi:peptidyl-prolyl cis-trans isomerase SurA